MTESDRPTEPLVIREQTAALEIDRKLRDPQYVSLIRDSYCKGATEQEFALAIETARHLRLDPTSRQIFFIKRWDSSLRREVMAAQVSIDGLRLVADRTGKYAGQTEPQWCGPDGEWQSVWLAAGPPSAARVGILRRDFAAPVYAVARYASYVQTKRDGAPNSMWAKMPDLMLSKVAEALALRKTFPSEMSGAYTEDEMGQAQNETWPTQAKLPPVPAQATPPAAQPGSVYAVTEEWTAKIKNAETVKALSAIAAELRAAELPEAALKTVRPAWQARHDEVADTMSAIFAPPAPAPEPEPSTEPAPAEGEIFGFPSDDPQP